MLDSCQPSKKTGIQAEVVGFSDENVILMPYTSVNDIAPGSLVEATSKTIGNKSRSSINWECY